MDPGIVGGGKIVHVNQKEKIIDLIVAQSFTGDRQALIPSSVMRRNPEASRSMAENHIFGREAPAHRRHKSSALCYDPENAPRNALATRQRPARRVRVAFPRAEAHRDMSRTCKIGASYRSHRLISETSRTSRHLENDPRTTALYSKNYEIEK